MDESLKRTLEALATIGLGLATNALYELTIVVKKREEDQPNAFKSAVQSAAALHQDPASARWALHAWFQSGSFKEVIQSVLADPKQVASLQLVERFNEATDFENPIQNTAHVATVIRQFFVEYRAQLLRSRDGNLVLSEQLEHTRSALANDLHRLTDPLRNDLQRH